MLLFPLMRSGTLHMVNILAVAVGAAIGANLRYGLGLWVAQRFGTAFPYGTLLINLLGCFVIGALLTLAATRFPLSEPLRLLLVTGLLGGFTTFSSFGYETYSLITGGDFVAAGFYVASSLGLGLVAVFLGASLVRLFGS